MIEPDRFNTWSLISTLAAGTSQRLEVGAGLHPRLPIAGTHFVDLSFEALSRFRGKNGCATLGEITDLPFPDGVFDLVCAFDIVEHVEDDARVFRELTRVARDHAPIILSVPLDPGRWSAFDDLVGHVRRYEPRALLSLLGRHGLQLEQSAVFGMEPKSIKLLDLAAWALTHRQQQALRWYTKFFLPLGLRLQKPLAWKPGLVDVTKVAELVLLCRRASRRVVAG